MNSYKDLAQNQIELLPTENDVQLYEKRGWYISPKILPEDLLNAAVKGAQNFYAGERNSFPKKMIGIADDEYDDNASFLNNEYISLRQKEIQNLIYSPIVSAIAAKLCRTSEIRLFADGLMTKMPSKKKDGVFGWHTDKAYWPSCTSNKMLTAWIPLQDVTLDMGPITVIENSHHWELDAELRQYCAAGNKDLKSFEEYLKENRTDYRFVPLTLKKGQISFHTGNLFHASAINTSEKKRMAVAIHLQDESNTYKAAFKDNGDKIVIGYEKNCSKDADGNPDYRDKMMFPVLWDEKLDR
jgi:hypothetical protein